MRKRSAETQLRHMRVAMKNATVALGYVANPHTRPAYCTDDFLRRLADDVLHGLNRELAPSPRRARRRA